MRKILIVAVMAANVVAQPCAACVDWQAIAAFDAVLSENARAAISEFQIDLRRSLDKGEKIDANDTRTSGVLYKRLEDIVSHTEEDRNNAIHGNCGDNKP